MEAKRITKTSSSCFMTISHARGKNYYYYYYYFYYYYYCY